jgi:hypothetical protein
VGVFLAHRQTFEIARAYVIPYSSIRQDSQIVKKIPRGFLRVLPIFVKRLTPKGAKAIFAQFGLLPASSSLFPANS